jgi:hypothetical protein
VAGYFVQLAELRVDADDEDDARLETLRAVFDDPSLLTVELDRAAALYDKDRAA